jgi:hypothetical protein
MLSDALQQSDIIRPFPNCNSSGLPSDKSASLAKGCLYSVTTDKSPLLNHITLRRMTGYKAILQAINSTEETSRAGQVARRRVVSSGNPFGVYWDILQEK